MLRKNITWLLAVIFAAMLETTWLEHIRYHDVVPDLTLLMVLYFAIVDGEERAMLTGAVGGIFQDVASNATLGHHVLCHVIVGYIAARVAARMITEHPAAKAGLVLGAGILSGLLAIAVAYIQDPSIPAFHNIIARVVPGSFYTALFTPLMFFILDRIFRRKKSPWTLSRGVAR